MAQTGVLTSTSFNVGFHESFDASVEASTVDISSMEVTSVASLVLPPLITLTLTRSGHRWGHSGQALGQRGIVRGKVGGQG